MPTQVPVSVLHRRGIVRLDGGDPLLLNAYGAYGAPEDASFDARRLSLLDRCVQPWTISLHALCEQLVTCPEIALASCMHFLRPTLSR